MASDSSYSFLILVDRMRKAQKNYFILKRRSLSQPAVNEALAACLALEKEVDLTIQRLSNNQLIMVLPCND